MANTNFLEQLCNLLAKLGTLYPHTPAQLAALHRAYNRIQMKICAAQEQKKITCQLPNLCYNAFDRTNSQGRRVVDRRFNTVN